jgi:hypothetical protein
MRTFVRAGCAAMLAALAACQSMAGGAAPKPVPTATEMRVSVVGADNVVISDSDGRRYPCRDSSCRSIPRAHAVSGFGTRPRGDSAQSVPKLIVFAILGPAEGAYRIHVSDAEPHVWLTVDVSDSTMRCGKGDAVDWASGASHDWVVKWRRTEGDTSCVLTLARERLPGKK